MPQMAPMNWLSLYSMFSIILMMTVVISFFQFLYIVTFMSVISHFLLWLTSIFVN